MRRRTSTRNSGRGEPQRPPAQSPPAPTRGSPALGKSAAAITPATGSLVPEPALFSLLHLSLCPVRSSLKRSYLAPAHAELLSFEGSAHGQTVQFARGSVFSNQPTQQKLHEQDKYKAYLKQQIDEKMLKKAEERERTRLEEEIEEKRLAEQRARIQKEFDEEQERKKRKEMEQKAKNEELIELTERRKKEMERKKNEAEEKERAAMRRQYERERQARVEKEVCREPSPPIPTLQKRHGPHQYTPTPPTVDSQHSTAPLSEGSLSGLQSPPVPARRNQLRAAGDQRDVFSELSALRRHLRSEEKRLEGRLQQVDWEELDSPLSDRHRERPQVDVFDMARLRLPAPVRRPNSRNTEPRNLLRIHDSLQLKHSEECDGEVCQRLSTGLRERFH
uniref:Centrosome and spindle pole associated protein 1a n=1 Tax=Gasterosteus aculeatus aculeatus TaxID=481459 RepID=G3Q7V1_GASAC